MKRMRVECLERLCWIVTAALYRKTLVMLQTLAVHSRTGVAKHTHHEHIVVMLQ
jgi:hypothetical protein